MKRHIVKKNFLWLSADWRTYKYHSGQFLEMTDMSRLTIVLRDTWTDKNPGHIPECPCPSNLGGQCPLYNTGQRLLMLILRYVQHVICHARVIQYYCSRSNIRSCRSIRSCHYCAALLCGIAPRVQS